MLIYPLFLFFWWGGEDQGKNVFFRKMSGIIILHIIDVLIAGHSTQN